jgi:hypothetical protein
MCGENTVPPALATNRTSKLRNWKWRQQRSRQNMVTSRDDMLRQRFAEYDVANTSLRCQPIHDPAKKEDSCSIFNIVE